MTEFTLEGSGASEDHLWVWHLWGYSAMFYDDMKLATVCACPEASWTGLLFRQGQLLPVTGLELSGRSYKAVCSWSLNACAGPGGAW